MVIKSFTAVTNYNNEKALMCLPTEFRTQFKCCPLTIAKQETKVQSLQVRYVKAVLHPWTLFLKTFYIFTKNKATLDKVSNGSDKKCSKELKNHIFISTDHGC